MPSTVIHPFDTAWASSDSSRLVVTVAPDGVVAPRASNRLSVPVGATGAHASFQPAAPLDLSAFDELRFWIRANRRADGSPAAPFYLELSYTDAGDAVGEEHRWYLPVNRAGGWEQRRIGIAGDRRTAVTRFRLTCLDDAPFAADVDELLAVGEQMLADLDAALSELLGAGVSVPGLTGIPLAQSATPPVMSVVLGLTPGFATGNLILLSGGSAGPELHTVTGVTDSGGSTTLALGEPVRGTMAAGTATASVHVPVIVEAPPASTVAISPAIVLTPLGVEEDDGRTPYTQQRDSFRPRGTAVACSVRSSARAYLADYEITVLAPARRHQVAIADQVVPRVSADVGVRVNGAVCPIWVLPSIAPSDRKLGVLAALTIRVGTRCEIAPRTEEPLVRSLHVGAGRTDTLDTEGIVLQL